MIAGQYIRSIFNVDHRFSASALSKLSPTPPVDGAMPASTRRWVNRTDVYWQPLSLLNRIRFAHNAETTLASSSSTNGGRLTSSTALWHSIEPVMTGC